MSDREVQIAALPALIDVLMNEKDGQVRLAVFESVTSLGPVAESAVPALLHTLRSDFGGLRREELHQDYRSALALAAIGAPAVEGLCSLLSEKRENVRAEAIMALGRIGPDAGSAVPVLIPKLGDESDRIRQEASTALGRIGPAAFEPLIEASKQGEPLARSMAIKALGASTEPDDRIQVAVLDRLGDESPEVRAAALTALGRIDAPAELLVNALDEGLQEEHEAIRLAAVNQLVERQDLIPALLPTLKSRLVCADEGAARHSAFILQLLGPDAAPILLEALGQEGSQIVPIAEALAQIGQPISKSLLDAIEAPGPRVRQGAAHGPWSHPSSCARDHREAKRWSDRRRPRGPSLVPRRHQHAWTPSPRGRPNCAHLAARRGS